MTVTIEFKCKRCGLLTPGLAELSAGVKPNEKIQFSVSCFHCGKRLVKATTAAKAARSKR